MNGAKIYCIDTDEDVLVSEESKIENAINASDKLYYIISNSGDGYIGVNRENGSIEVFKTFDNAMIANKNKINNIFKITFKIK